MGPHTKSEALTTTTALLQSVQTLGPSDTRLLPEYVLPAFSRASTDPEELALEATKRSFDPALAAAAFSRQPDMVRMLMAHASARGLKSALLVAGTQRGEGCVPVLKVLLGKELACAPGAALGEVAVAAAQRGAMPSLKLLLGARGDDTKGPPPRLVQKALMAAAAKRYYGAVKMLLPKVDDAAKERLAIFAGFVADQGGGDGVVGENLVVESEPAVGIGLFQLIEAVQSIAESLDARRLNQEGGAFGKVGVPNRQHLQHPVGSQHQGGVAAEADGVKQARALAVNEEEQRWQRDQPDDVGAAYQADRRGG